MSGKENDMEKITGMEAYQDVPAKVLLIYDAVEQLIIQEQDLNTVKVSTITEKAGIGKGTAYAYFETKDDIIACALLYQIRKMCDELADAVSEKESLGEKINFLLDEIEQKKVRRQSFLRLVHVLTENTGYCQLVRQKMSSKEFHMSIPVNRFTHMVQEGIAGGEIKPELPAEYVISCIASRLFMYMVYFCAEGCFPVNPTTLRPYIYKGLMEELCGNIQH